LFSRTAVQQRQDVDAVWCSTVFSRLISTFAFDTLQIPSKCIAICSECITHTCTFLVTDLGEIRTIYHQVANNSSRFQASAAMLIRSAPF
jgi:hypothetical protein